MCHERDIGHSFVLMVSLNVCHILCCHAVSGLAQTICVGYARKRWQVDAAMTHLRVLPYYLNRGSPNIVSTSSGQFCTPQLLIKKKQLCTILESCLKTIRVVAYSTRKACGTYLGRIR